MKGQMSITDYILKAKLDLMSEGKLPSNIKINPKYFVALVKEYNEQANMKVCPLTFPKKILGLKIRVTSEPIVCEVY